MYDPDKPLKAATTQELWTALLLKRRFNEFDPVPIVTDLYAQPHLWQKVWLGWLVFEVDFYQKTAEAPIARLLEMLVYAQDHRLYTNDVLYIQSADDEFVPALLDLAKRWQADDVQVFDRDRMAEIIGRLTMLIQTLGQDKMQQQIEHWKAESLCAPVLALWWD